MNLIDIHKNFVSLCKAVREGDITQHHIMNNDLVSALNLSMDEAMVLAWLKNHADNIYPVSEMCKDLDIPTEEIDTILLALLSMGYVEKERVAYDTGKNGSAFDLSASLEYLFLDKICAEKSRLDDSGGGRQASKMSGIWNRFQSRRPLSAAFEQTLLGLPDDEDGDSFE